MTWPEWTITLPQALRWTEFVFAWSLALQTLEYLRMGAATHPEGLWSWTLQRRDIPVAAVRRALDVLFHPVVHQGHLVVRLLLAVLLCVSGGSWGLIAFLFVGNLLILIRWRGAFNGGSDFMTLVVLTGLLIAYTVGTWVDAELGVRAGLWYICIQSVTSYFMSGAVKLLRVQWRNGEAMTIFLNAAIYGPLPPQHWLRHRVWAMLGSWGFIAWECAFPFALVGPWHAVAFCAVAAVFHFLVFWFFGLNRFFWAWMASFPAIVWCAGQRLAA
jgi:hypothetical protein